MQELIITCLAFVLLSIITKFIFWVRIEDRRPRNFYRSFFRYYSIYDLHDVTSNTAIAFCKLSNFLNIIFWIAVAILIITGFINLPTTD